MANKVISEDAENVVLTVAERDNDPLIVLAEEPLRLPRALADALDKAEILVVLEREGPEVANPLSVVHIVDLELILGLNEVLGELESIGVKETDSEGEGVFEEAALSVAPGVIEMVDVKTAVSDVVSDGVALDDGDLESLVVMDGLAVVDIIGERDPVSLNVTCMLFEVDTVVEGV